MAWGAIRDWWARLAAFSVAGVSVAILLVAVWPEPARPHVPVPQIQLTPNSQGALFFADLVPWQEGLTALPMTVNGRASNGAKGALLQEWPAFHVEARFRGTAFSVRFEDTANRWRILIDKGRGGKIELSRPGVNDLRIQGLPDSEHLVRVEKISESSMPASFGGVLISPQATALPEPRPRPRMIEFIGDSDTVGFGGTASMRDCSEEEIFAATDTSRAFGPRTAEALGADYRVIARSGIGLLRNAGDWTPQETMTSRYSLALPSDPTAARLPVRPADIVVTALGSNDLIEDPEPGWFWSERYRLAEGFGSALTAFLRDRAKEYPDALQVLLVFPDAAGGMEPPYRAAEAALKADGTRVITVSLPKLDRKGCAWHPSPADHEVIARWLTAAIRAQMP